MDSKAKARRSTLHYLIVIFLSALQFGVVLWYAGDKPLPLGKDEGLHLLNALRVFRALSESNTPGALYHGLINIRINYPPGLYLAAAAAKALVPTRDVLSSLLSLFPFVVVMNLGLFILARRLDSTGAGYAAVLVNASVPALVHQLPIFNMGLPHTALIPFLLLLLYKSRLLTVTSSVLYASLIIALGTWIHFTFLVYAAVPILILAAWGLASDARNKTALNLALLVGIVFALTAPYFFNPEIVASIGERIDRFVLTGFSQGELVPGLSAPLNKYLFYPYALVARVFGPVLSMAILILWILLALKDRSLAVLTACFILGPVILFSFSAGTSPERLVPVVPVAAVVVVLGTRTVERKISRRVLACAIAVLCAFSLFASTRSEHREYRKIALLDLAGIAADLDSLVLPGDRVLGVDYSIEWLEYYARAERLQRLQTLSMVSHLSQEFYISPEAFDLLLIQNPRTPWFDERDIVLSLTNTSYLPKEEIPLFVERLERLGESFLVQKEYDFGEEEKYWILRRASSRTPSPDDQPNAGGGID